MKKLYILATASALVLSGCESVTAVATQGVAAISDAGSTAWNSVVQQGQIASIAEQQKSLPPSTLSVDKSTQEEYDSATAAYQKTVAQGAVLGRGDRGCGLQIHSRCK
jgi:PBP1b-binding outer membrane lipoprotein LpoB